MINMQEKIMRIVVSLVIAGTLMGSRLALMAETPEDARASSPSPTKTQTTNPTSTDDLNILKQQVAQQQAQIEQLLRAIDQLKARVDGTTQAQREGPATTPTAAQVASLAPVLPANAAAPASVVGQYSGSQAEGKPKSPLTLRVGDADLTVGGFMDFTAFFRTTNLGSGIGSSFGSVPFSNTTAGHLTESRFSAQNSRVSLQADTNVGANKIRGYVEADFLGFQPVNGFVTSNSNSMRMRLYWVQVRRGKFEVFGGQTWSMLVPGRNGISPMPSDLFYSQNMDTNYQVGLTWTRAAEFRVIYHPSPQWAMGIALENAEQNVTGALTLPGGGCTATTPPTPLSPYCNQVDIAGAGGSTATPNLHPDIIGKIAYDPEIAGKHMHAEVAGILRSFRTFNPATNTSNVINGAGGSVNLNLEMVKNFHLILNSFYSDGGGRYIFGLGPDFIIKPDGTPSAVHAASAIGGFEYQANPKTMLYGYYGGAYFQRNTAIDPTTGKFLGFGFPGSSSSSNRAIQEPTFGFVQTFWKNPRYGALQWINQYSYVTRSPWSVASGAPRTAHLSMVYTDLRYVLP
jgi:hypothetical protein